MQPNDLPPNPVQGSPSMPPNPSVVNNPLSGNRPQNPTSAAQNNGPIGLIIAAFVGVWFFAPVGFILAMMANTEAKRRGTSTTAPLIAAWIGGILTALLVIYFLAFIAWRGAP